RLLRRVALGGAVAALLAGSAGVAVAQSMMPHGFDDPWDAADYRHSFALPSGRGCELRIMV
ncbi:hypothetical protein, partial [Microbacterium sp.]|uniref:hypothetical protein n=1 Tax=Microbacterium sp. TaxID=51671 RepID=UPI003C72887A